MLDQEQKQVNILKIMVSKNKFVPGPADSINRFSWVNVEPKPSTCLCVSTCEVKIKSCISSATFWLMPAMWPLMVGEEKWWDPLCKCY